MLFPDKLLLVAVMVVVVCSLCAQGIPLNGRKVVIMSMDGFRYDYFKKSDKLKNFDALKASGATVPYVNNTFVTRTFPSHYSIVTGLYEESHGVVGNDMYDPVFDAYFKKGNTETRWWNGAQPVWINAVKSGIRTGASFWPGSDVEIDGFRPTHWEPYREGVSFESRIDTLVDDWLVKEGDDFGVIYFDEPDSTGHKDGPESPGIVTAIERMDGLLGYFMDKLEANGLKNKVDFILTSDHGMTSIDFESRATILTDYIDYPSKYIEAVVSYGPVAQIRTKPGKAQEFAHLARRLPHMKVYLKENIPDHFHFKHHRRIMDVLIIAEEGYLFFANTDDQLDYGIKGTHGYSNELMSMKPIFIASGPSFGEGVVADPILNVDIYPLLCYLLNIQPAPNNGSCVRVQPLLRDYLVPSYNGSSYNGSSYNASNTNASNPDVPCPDFPNPGGVASLNCLSFQCQLFTALVLLISMTMTWLSSKKL